MNDSQTVPHPTSVQVPAWLKAFGAAPGTMLAVGVLTDTDNTGETADAWYGDIRLVASP